MPGKKKFNRDQVSDALRSSGISSDKQAEVLGALEGTTSTEQPTTRSRGGGAASEATPNFTF